jgi:hypothetical protein
MMRLKMVTMAKIQWSTMIHVINLHHGLGDVGAISKHGLDVATWSRNIWFIAQGERWTVQQARMESTGPYGLRGMITNSTIQSSSVGKLLRSTSGITTTMYIHLKRLWQARYNYILLQIKC